MFYRLADAQVAVDHPPHPVGHRGRRASTRDGTLLAVRANVEGRNELRFFDADTFDELPSPRAARRAASPGRDFHPRSPVLAFALDSSSGPSQVGIARPGRRRARSPGRAPYAPPGVDTAAFGEQQIVRWKSFDGREISGIAQRCRRRASPASGRC